MAALQEVFCGADQWTPRLPTPPFNDIRIRPFSGAGPSASCGLAEQETKRGKTDMTVFAFDN